MKDTPMKPLVDVKDLRKWFHVEASGDEDSEHYVKAVDDVTFVIYSGETFSVVGESGCGKSTLGRVILRLIEPSGGEVLFEGCNLFSLSRREMRQMRRHMQMIFQDPYGSLNSRMKVHRIVGEPLLVSGMRNRRLREEKISELLSMVGLSPEHALKYPHEFSGGQRQRIGIARAIALNPKLVVCDEPVSALDVSIQAQVINLLKELQNKLNLTYLFISHDLSVVKYISDRVAVMYLGKFVELATKQSLFATPLHPYTQALLSAIPVPGEDHKKNRILLEGDVPSPIDPPSGCRFRTRCRFARKLCEEEEPLLLNKENGHWVACHIV